MADLDVPLKAIPPAVKNLKKVKRAAVVVPTTTKSGAVSARYVSEEIWDAAI